MYMYIYIYIYMCVYIYIYTHICIYIHTRTPDTRRMSAAAAVLGLGFGRRAASKIASIVTCEASVMPNRDMTAEVGLVHILKDCVGVGQREGGRGGGHA